MRRALFVAAFDSQLKWCGRIRDELEARGYQCDVVVPDLRAALSPGQIAAAGFSEVEQVTWAELVERAALTDVVVCSLAGPLTRTLAFDLADRLERTAQPGPVLVSGWVGVIIERITAGYLDRCGSDVVAVNSVADLDHFQRTARALRLPTENLLLTGLPFLSGSPAAQRSDVRRLLFADQPAVPASAAERRFLYEGAIRYARAHPDREVVLKPRHRPEEDTFHRMRHHPATLLAGVDLPPNFAITYTPVTELLPDVDLLVTVSSTACLEALDQGCQVALLLDLGVHERYGNHVFLDSGLLRTWQEVTADELGTPQPDWLASYFFPRPRSSAQAIADRVTELLDSGLRPAAAVRASDYFQSSAAYHRTRPGPGRAASRAARALRVRDFVPPVLHRPLHRTRRRVRALVDAATR